MYEGWQKVQTHLTHAVPKLGPDELQLTTPAGWPIWAIVGHVAGARVYWLCRVFKEPGAETTPWGDPLADGWEDRLDLPRRSDELMFALESSWGVVESCLQRWTPEMLDQTFTREIGGKTQVHTRHSVLTRIVMHDSFHCGEISMLLGVRALPSLDPWEPIT